MTEPFPDQAPPPRQNGELVFDHPWQSRLFGLTAGLVDAGFAGWPQMQRSLIEHVRRADAAGADTGEPSVYWSCWLEGLVDLGVVDGERLSALVDELRQREVGHDH